MVKNQPCNAGDLGSIPSPGRSHVSQSNKPRVLPFLKPEGWEPVLCNRESPAVRNPAWRWRIAHPPTSPSLQLEHVTKTCHSQNIKVFFYLRKKQYCVWIFSSLQVATECYFFLRKSKLVSDGACVILGHLLQKLSPFPCLLLFSHAVMSDSLRPHGLQHARLPCPSLSPWVCSNSHPLIQWCHPTLSSSVIPFLCCLQSFPAAGPFPISQLCHLPHLFIW